MQNIRLKSWVKIAIVLLSLLLAYLIFGIWNSNGEIKVNTSAQINSVEMISTSPLFLQESMQVTNLTDTGFNIVWISEDKTGVGLTYSDINSELEDTVQDERVTLENRNPSYYIHSVKVPYLKPESEYQISIDQFDIDPVKNQITTFKTLRTPPAYIPIAGRLITDLDITEALFLFTMIDGRGKELSTKISTTLLDNNSWVTSIGDMRDLETGGYIDFSDKVIRIEVYTIDAVYTVETKVSEILDTELEVIIK